MSAALDRSWAAFRRTLGNSEFMKFIIANLLFRSRFQPAHPLPPRDPKDPHAQLCMDIPLIRGMHRSPPCQWTHPVRGQTRWASL